MAAQVDRATKTLRIPADRARGVREASPSEPFDTRPEMGFGGSKFVGGIVSEEHLAELRGQRAAQMATRMRRTDAQVRAVEKVISLPIRSTIWLLEEPDQAGSAEKEATELLRENLFGGMEHSWDDLIREGCLAIYYGWRVPEIVWEERDSLFRIRKVASRNPELVEQWLFDAQSNLTGYLYAGHRPIGGGLTVGSTAPSKYERIPIPIEKTLHFVYDTENENPQGFGLWRSMYPHYVLKQALYKMMAVGIERNLVGTPYGRLTKSATQGGNLDADKKALLSILQRLRVAHDGAFVLTEGQEVDWFESSRSVMDAMPFLHHQNAMIALVGLAQFLTLGMQSTGTQALASEHTKIFELAEEANANWLQETLQSQLIKRWCLLNYGAKLKPPRLMHKPIRAKDLTAWTAGLKSLVDGKLIHQTVDDEELIRDYFELPKIERAQLEALEAERKTAEAQRQEAERLRLQGPASPPAKPEPAPRKATEPGCGHTFAEGDGETARQERTAAEQSFEERAAELLGSIQEQYFTALRPLVDEAQDAGKLAKGKPIDRLPDVAVPGAKRYTQFVRAFLWEALDAGRKALETETGQRASERPVSNRLRQWVTARAEVIAADHLAQLKTAVLSRVLSGLRAELTTAQIFSEAGAAAIEEFNRNTARGWSQAAAEVLAELAGESTE
ncbi:MAG: DUF935 family protein [Armatimonadota bacterium]